MAGTKPEEQIEIGDDAVIEIDLSDKPELAAQLEEVTKAKPEEEEEGAPKKPVPRVRLAEPAAEPVADDATTVALREAVEKAAQSEAARKAAEATAYAERQRAEQATRLAQKRGQEVQEAREQVAEGQLSVIETGIASASQNLESLQSELQGAMEAGDFAKTAQVQTKISRAAATLDRLEAQKAEFESRKPVDEGAVEAVPVQASPLEQYLSQGFAPEAQTWLRQHPECAPANVGGNAQSNAKMMTGHYAAVAKGVPLNSPEYFQMIEEHTGHRKPVEPEPEPTPQPKPPVVAQPKPVKAAPSAPVSREPPSPSTGVPQNKRSVTLTPEQQEAALFSFPNLPRKEAFSQYARNLVELTAEGKIGRLTH